MITNGGLGVYVAPADEGPGLGVVIPREKGGALLY